MHLLNNTSLSETIKGQSSGGFKITLKLYKIFVYFVLLVSKTASDRVFTNSSALSVDDMHIISYTVNNIFKKKKTLLLCYFILTAKFIPVYILLTKNACKARLLVP